MSSRKITLILTAVSGVVILFFLMTLVNQLFAFTDLIARYNQTAGTLAFWTISLLLLGLLLVPVYYVVRLPARLEYPEEGDAAGIAAYRLSLCTALNRNPRLKKHGLVVRDDNLNHALSVLDAEARSEVKRTAGIVFVSTAISQSGKLDGLVVLVLLIKMVWRVAHIYHQRPAWSNLVHLYANVAGTTLIAASIEEIDMAEQMEPVIGELIGSTAFGSIPGLGQISDFVFRSVMEGAVNAFLALRMGEVAIGYSNSTTAPSRSRIRRSASLKALDTLRVVMKENVSEVIGALVKAGKKRLWFSKRPAGEGSDGGAAGHTSGGGHSDSAARGTDGGASTYGGSNAAGEANTSGGLNSSGGSSGWSDTANQDQPPRKQLPGKDATGIWDSISSIWNRK